MKNKYISAIVAGLGAGFIRIIPFAKSFACCLIIPAAAIIALSLDQKSRNDYSPIKASKAVIWGLITGVIAALTGSFVDIFITFVTKNNDIVTSLPEIQKMLSQFPASPVINDSISLFQKMAEDITSTGFSFLYTLLIFFNNMLIDPIFGMLGGLVGMQILNAKNEKNNLS